MALLQDVELVDKLIASYPEYVKIGELVSSGAVTQGVIYLHTSCQYSHCFFFTGRAPLHPLCSFHNPHKVEGSSAAKNFAIVDLWFDEKKFIS